VPLLPTVGSKVVTVNAKAVVKMTVKASGFMPTTALKPEIAPRIPTLSRNSTNREKEGKRALESSVANVSMPTETYKTVKVKTVEKKAATAKHAKERVSVAKERILRLSRNKSKRRKEPRSRPKSKATAESCPVALATAQAKAVREMVLAVMAKAKAKAVVKKLPAAKANVPRVVRETAMAAMAMLPRNGNRITRPKSKGTAESCPVALATAQAKAVREMVLTVMAKAKANVVKKVHAAKAKARTLRETVMAAMAMLSRNGNRISRPKSKATAESCPVALATAQAKAVREMVLIVMAKA